MFLQKVTLQIENTAPWKYVINYHNGEEIIGTFYEKKIFEKKKKKSRRV